MSVLSSTSMLVFKDCVALSKEFSMDLLLSAAPASNSSYFSLSEGV